MEDVKVNCANCKWFEVRTRFCRKFPPKPMMFITSEEKSQTGDISYCSSKFPTINFAQMDFCSFWEVKVNELVINEKEVK